MPLLGCLTQSLPRQHHHLVRFHCGKECKHAHRVASNNVDAQRLFRSDSTASLLQQREFCVPSSRKGDNLVSKFFALIAMSLNIDFLS